MNAYLYDFHPDGWPSTMSGRPHTQTKYKDAYAPSGYDLLSILVCSVMENSCCEYADR